ncbi:MAG: protein BatD [Williamsia sp.]|nr:protein BatD [Williamsia sp.]
MEFIFTRIRTCFLFFVATLSALLLCIAAGAQAKFSTVVNETQPGLNEYIQVEYTVENAKSVENIAPPSFKNFRLIQGPIQSSGMSIINGALSQYKSISYVLQPIVKGKLSIPGALAVIDGKPVRSNTVTIDVRSTGGSGNSSQNSGIMPVMPRSWPAEEPQVSEEYILRPGEKMSDKIKKNIFVQTDVNKTVCYEGEPIVATFKLCSRLRSESTVLRRPSLNGFSVYDMIEPEANRPSVESIGGKTFNVHTIRKTQLFPLQAGTFTIDPVELTNKVSFLRTAENHPDSRDPVQRFMDRFMNDENRGELEEQSFSLASKPVSVTVKPLPEAGKPAGFNGAVGKFIIYSELEKAVVPAGDPVTIKVQIKGEGNFTVINAPQLQLPAAFEGYDPVVKETVNKAIYPLTGTKTFTYTFSARDTGTYKIPKIIFSYFDPSRAAYQTVQSDSFTLKVTAPAKKSFFASHKIKINPATFDWRKSVSSATLWGIAAALLLILVCYLLVRKKRPAAKTPAPALQPVAAANPVQAEPIKEEPLQNARLALAEGRSQEFYGEVNKAVWKKLSATLQIPSTELNKFNVVSQLRTKGVNAEVVSQLEHVLNDCEIALYTPVHSASDMQQTLTRADAVIGAL